MILPSNVKRLKTDLKAQARESISKGMPTFTDEEPSGSGQSTSLAWQSATSSSKPELR